jgi:hypothetical protein
MGRRPPPGNRPRLKRKTAKARPEIIASWQTTPPAKIKVSSMI